MRMENKNFHYRNAGNATIYVLIVIALFAALALMVARQNDGSEAARLDSDRLRIAAAQVMAYPYQVKQSIEMMTMTGAETSDLDYTLPGQPDYDTSPFHNKIFHPEGGGLIRARLPVDVVSSASVTPAAGWYLGMFNDVEWSASTEPDVMLVAWPLREELCVAINQSLTGSAAIPVMGNTIPNIFIHRQYPTGNIIHGGTNADLTAAVCADCEDMPTLCVRDSLGRHGFYSMIVNR